MLMPDPLSPASAGRRHLANLWRRVRPAMAALCTLTLLAPGGCSGPQGFAPSCPQLALPSAASRFLRYASDTPDVSNLELDARIVAVPADCAWADKTHAKVKAELSLTISALRGPALRGNTIGLPYFVALSEGEHIFDKQIYVEPAHFAANTDQTTIITPKVSMLFPVTPTKRANAYTITVGFQLSPAQLEANRAHPAP